MKKLILAAGVLVSMLAATSCGHSDAGNTFEDSLSTTMGEANGSYLWQNFNTIPQDEQYHYKKADVLRGFKEVIMADTAARGYYAGLNIALQINQQLLEMENAGIKFDRARYLAAFSKAFMADTVVNLEEVQASLQRLMGQAESMMVAKRQADQEAAQLKIKEETVANEEAGTAYVKEQMANDPEIKMTESGLAYKVIKQGTGATCAADKAVKVIYTGTLIDGTQFDSSNGKPVSFVPQQTVPGFSEGLQMMNPGSHYILYIPAKLGYGNRQAGSIPPGSTLVFDVEVPAE